MNKNIKIYISGHNGMVGSACWRILKNSGYKNLIGKSSNELDLRNQDLVEQFINLHKPDVIINAAAKVGGILANSNFPYEFLLENMQIQNNLISSANNNDVKKFIFLGSSCIYPKFCPQPIKEEYILSSELEPTNQWYAIAKISGLKLIESLRIKNKRDYFCLMPTNLYGPNDNFDLNSSHVIPAMIRKFHEAKKNGTDVVLWGSGTPMREFLYVDDLARAILFSIENKLDEHMYNVGTGNDLTIKELAVLIQRIIGYNGKIVWDNSKPDGTPRKVMDNSKLLNLGWKPTITLSDGLFLTYNSYLNKSSLNPNV